MKTTFFKLTSLLLMLVLGMGSASAINLDITLPQAGELINLVTMDQLPKVENLKLTGDMNGTDLLVIRSMSNLKVLDLADANIRAGGRPFNDENDTTKNDTIGDCPFGLHSLDKVILPNSVTTIDARKLVKEGSIGNLVLGRDLNEICQPYSCIEVDTLSFRCRKIRKAWMSGLPHGANAERPFLPQVIVIDDGVEMIEDHAFSSCYQVGTESNHTARNFFTSLILKSSSISSFGHHVFINCKNLSSLVIADGVTKLGDYAFTSCESLNEISLPATIETIGDWAFGYLPIKHVTIPESVNSLGKYVLSHSQVESVQFANGISHIPAGMFANCEMLRNVDFLPSSVKSVGDSAFFSCVNLKDVKLPENIEEMGSYIFYNVHNIENLNIPRSLHKIGQNAFSNRVANVYFDDFNTWYNMETTSSLGSSWEVDSNLSVRIYDAGKLLNKIIVPSHVTKIRTRLFCGFSEVDTIALHNGITEINTAAFYRCYNLKSIKLPDEITSIPKEAFYECKNLESVYIPYKVSSIGQFAFYGCKNISRMIVRNPIPPQLKTEFFVDLSHATLYVPKGSGYDYYIDPHWGNFGNLFEEIIEIPENGDANADDRINVSDVTTLVNMILEVVNVNDIVADVNGDGKVNVSDVTALINKILGVK